MFRCVLERSRSREIVIFCFKIFAQSGIYQRRSYSQCQPTNIVMSSANTPSYNIQWREDAANCNDDCEMWLVLVIFEASCVKINKKCHWTTSFSINNDVIDTLSLTYFFSNAIRCSSFIWTDLYTVQIIAWLPLCHATHGFDHPKSNNITAKGPNPDMQYVPSCCLLLPQPISCKCNASFYQITNDTHLLHLTLISVKDDAFTLIGNKSAIPCQFLLQLLWIVYQIILQWYPQVPAI